jgi:hypothetical protein
MIRGAAAFASCGLAVAAAASLRDPFAPPPVPHVEGATPLQQLEIDRVRLVALVYEPVARALLEDEAGIGYVAGVGTPIGPRGGTVVRIARGKLRIREPAAPGEVVLELRATAEGAR